MTEAGAPAPKRGVVVIRADTAQVAEAVVAVVLNTGPTTVAKAANKAAGKAADQAEAKAVAHGVHNGTTHPAVVDQTAGSVAKAVSAGPQRAAARTVVEAGAVDVEPQRSRRTR